MLSSLLLVTGDVKGKLWHAIEHNLEHMPVFLPVLKKNIIIL